MPLLLNIFAAAMLIAKAPSPLKALALGDSHTAVEAGMQAALNRHMGQPISYAYLGINGAQSNDILGGFTQRKSPFTRAISWGKTWCPDIVLIAVGTNESVGKPSENYEAHYLALIRQVQNAFPSAQVIALGPPPASAAKLPYLNRIRILQSHAAWTAKVAWVDRAFLSEIRLQPDGIHLTRSSYQELADAVASRISASYRPLPGPIREGSN